jgi:hypothetical protein
VKDREHHLLMMKHIKRFLGLRPWETKADANGQVRIALQFEDTGFALRFLLKVFDLRIEESYAAWTVYKTKPIPLNSATTINHDSPTSKHTRPKRKREATPPSSPMKRRKISDVIELSSSPSVRSKPLPHVIDLASPPPRTMVAAGPTLADTKSVRAELNATQAPSLPPVLPPPTETPVSATTKKTRADVTAGAEERANVRRKAKAESKAANADKANAQPAKQSTNPQGRIEGTLVHKLQKLSLHLFVPYTLVET